MVVAEQLGQGGVGGAAAVEVCPGGHHHEGSLLRVSGRFDERGGEGVALLLGAAGGEQLLELVDGEQQPLAGRKRVDSCGERVGVIRSQPAGKLRQRVLTWPDQHPPPAFATWQHSGGQSGEEACPEQGGLAAARGAHDAEQAGADEVGDQLGHEPLATEEVVGIGGLEAGETLEGADVASLSATAQLGNVEAGTLAHQL